MAETVEGEMGGNCLAVSSKSAESFHCGCFSSNAVKKSRTCLLRFFRRSFLVIHKYTTEYRGLQVGCIAYFKKKNFYINYFVGNILSPNLPSAAPIAALNKNLSKDSI